MIFSFAFFVLGSAGSFFLSTKGGENADLFLFMGWGGTITALYIGTVVLIDRNVIYKLSAGISRILYKESAVAFAIAGMNQKQLDAFTARYIMRVDRAVLQFRGVQLEPDFIIRELQKADVYYPDYPSVRVYTEEGRITKPEEIKRKVLRDYLRATGRLEPRDGQTDRWTNGWDGKSVLEWFGYIEEERITDDLND